MKKENAICSSKKYKLADGKPKKHEWKLGPQLRAASSKSSAKKEQNYKLSEKYTFYPYDEAEVSNLKYIYFWVKILGYESIVENLHFGVKNIPMSSQTTLATTPFNFLFGREPRPEKDKVPGEYKLACFWAKF